jgi:hypothetical protein
MTFSRCSFIAIIFVLMVLIVPVLAKQESDEEDQYKLNDEWKGKPMVVEKHGELTQVVFLTLVPLGDSDGDGNQDAYDLLGYKWFSSPVKYTINPSTPVKKYALNRDAVVNAVKNSFETWDNQIDQDLYADALISTSAKASLGRPDYKNVVTWGTLSDKRVIAVTNIWYYTSTGQIVDSDMIFNTYYKWGIDQDGEGGTYSLTTTFDIQNIGTHEAGHVCGLNDIYDSMYSAMTMYGYGSPGEVYKISLAAGDVAGIQAIY